MPTVNPKSGTPKSGNAKSGKAKAKAKSGATTVTVHEAKTTLSALLRRVEAGEEIIIARGDKPVAILKGHDRAALAAKRLAGRGCLEGIVPPQPDSAFFDPLDDDDLDAFYESKIP